MKETTEAALAPSIPAASAASAAALTVIPAAPLPGLGLATRRIDCIDRDLLVGEAHRLAAPDDLAFQIKVGVTTGVTGQDLHAFLKEVRAAALGPLFEAALVARDGHQGERARKLAARLAESKDQAAECDVKASEALAKARQALHDGEDSARHERTAREAKIQADIIANRIQALTELAAAAEAEAVEAVRQAVAAKQVQLHQEAQARFDDVARRLGQALDELLPEYLKAFAEVRQLEGDKRLVAVGGERESLAWLIALGEPLPRVPVHGSWVW